MPIATYRGEKSVADIADKLYLKLTPRQRETAEAAILKANPQLTDLRRVPDGAVLRVPDIPELRPKTNRTLENPDTQIADTITDALGALGKRLAACTETATASAAAQAKLLKSAALKQALANEPELQAAADAASKALAGRAKALETRQAALTEAIRTATAALAGKKR